MEEEPSNLAEFLMTYGWAIIVVLVAIGALTYFGVLSPDRFLPEKCTLPTGLACIDFYSTDGGFFLYIQNTYYDMGNISVRLDGNNKCYPSESFNLLEEGKIGEFYIPCDFNVGKSKYVGDIHITYTNIVSGVEHTKIGELVANT